MLAGKQLLYLSTNHGWSNGWTFYQMLAEALARRNDVVYVDPPLSIARARSLGALRVEATATPTGPRVLRTPTVPLQRREAVRRAAGLLLAREVAGWARRERFAPDLVWTYAPAELEVARRFPAARVVYW